LHPGDQQTRSSVPVPANAPALNGIHVSKCQ
jgi:hypothetical protein